MNDSSRSLLSQLEIRVLGVLAEKQRTVPDIYPLTLSALVSGCNQKSSRNPVMNVSQTDVLAAIDRLKQESLVSKTSGGRSERFAHHLERVLKIPVQSVALMVTLMLRGPQTAGELRLNSERLYKFADISSVEGFLDELVDHKDGSLVVKLPRKSGSRENRWTHLLSDEPEIKESDGAAAVMCNSSQTEKVISNSDFIALKTDVERLETDLAELRKAVEELSTLYRSGMEQYINKK